MLATLLENVGITSKNVDEKLFASLLKNVDEKCWSHLQKMLTKKNAEKCLKKSKKRKMLPNLLKMLQHLKNLDKKLLTKSTFPKNVGTFMKNVGRRLQKCWKKCPGKCRLKNVGTFIK
jgi:tRNA nucleotidyltransferase/poly(A) polymerase